MNISARCEYACRAVLELARHARTGEPVPATAIAERGGIPEKYLAHIMLELKRAGIVRSTRGAQGGYTLGRLPEAITLLDVVQAIEGPVLVSTPGGASPSPELAAAWTEAAEGVSAALREVTFQAIIDRAPQPDMYYI